MFVIFKNRTSMLWLPCVVFPLMMLLSLFNYLKSFCCKKKEEDDEGSKSVTKGEEQTADQDSTESGGEPAQTEVSDGKEKTEWINIKGFEEKYKGA